MSILNHKSFIFSIFLSLLLVGCATPSQRDYTAYQQANPKSILVLPPVNDSPEVMASNSMLSQMTYPLAEAGYYVFPVSVVEATFKENGYTQPTEVQSIPFAKLHDIFGADSALYVKINEYGTQYQILQSVVTVGAEAKLVDLRSGQVLWEGMATASNKEGSNSSGGGLVGMLVSAVVEQIVNHVSDVAHPIAGLTSNRLLSAGVPNGILYGPRSPFYKLSPK